MNKPKSRYFEFDNFRADPQNKCLWYGSEIVSLTPRAFDTLLVLIENKGQVVDKNTLMDRVWSDAFVEEAALKQNISTLRKKFESLQIGKQFIETIPRRGYRFVGEAKEIYDEEEVYLVETRTRTHIIANQEIHISGETTPAIQTKSRKLILTGVLASIAILTASFFAIRYFLQPQPMSENRFKQFEIKQITASGNIHKVAISPDGKYLALVEKKDDLQTLLLRQTDNSNNIEIIPPTKDDIIGVTFSPNSDAIFYSVYSSLEANQFPRYGVLKKVPILGGTETEILRDIDSPVSISPDGKKYAFIRNKIAERESSIILFDSHEQKETILATRKISDRFNEDRIAWSPDGSLLAVVAYSSKDNTKPFEVIVIKTENGEQSVLTNEKWSWMGQLAWLSDGSGLILTAFREDSPNFTDEVWVVSYPEGKLRKVTNGINGFYGLGATSDSKSLVTVKSDRIVGLWRVSKDNLQDPVQILKNISNGSRYKFRMDLRGSKIAYSSAQLGNADVWMMNSDGSQSKQLTGNEEADFNPIISPTENHIVFISNRSGTKNIWRMSMDGTNQVQITNFQNVFSPSVSPDGNWIYFAAGENSYTKPTLWKTSINGGEPQKLTDLMTFEPKISPDGKYVACFYPTNGEKANQMKPLKLTLLSAIDGVLIKQFEVLFNETQFDWTPDSKNISFITKEEGKSAIQLQPIEGGKPQKFFTSQNETIFSHRWATDGKSLVMEKGTIINDVILIK